MPYPKKCVSCGTPFVSDNIRKVKCKRDCGRHSNAARSILRENHELEFIAVDGEGIDVAEWVPDWIEATDSEGNGLGYYEEIAVKKEIHQYVLISVGDKSLHRNGKHLSYDEIFTFLWEQFLEHPQAVFVGFFLGYDFTMWLKSLDEYPAWKLLHKEGVASRQPAPDSPNKFPWPVRDGGWRYFDGERGFQPHKWEFDILGQKRFKLRPYVKPENVPTRIVNHRDGTTSVQKVQRPWMYICDAGPFFQTSFLNAINPKGWERPIVSLEEYETIERGKKRRDVAAFDAEMIEYNLLENDVLARLMSLLNEGFVSDGIRLSRKQWMGPGQAAQEWMKLIGVPTGEEIREVVPAWARDAGRKCYYGGWFEIFNHGPVPGKSYAYDINSAYPYVIASLPCLLHGRWTRGKGRPGSSLPQRGLQAVYATLRGSDKWVGAAPYRTRDGLIQRPNRVKGWYWQHEIDAGIRAGVIDKVTTHEYVRYYPCPCDPPMAAIRDLYNGRLRVGKNSPEGKSKKLTYNSAYGKFAQSIGDPRFGNPIYASLITAGCRTMILNAIATHPTKTESLLMVATDGIYFAEPHPNLDLDEERLGAWDQKVHENLSLFMPGLYWDDKARQAIAEEKTPNLKSRGVSAKDLGNVIGHVDRQWSRFLANLRSDNPNPDMEWPKRELKVEWSITSGKLAITRGDWASAGSIQRGIPRKLNGDPWSKRPPQYIFEVWGGIRTIPYAEGVDGLETSYYQRTFGDTELLADDIMVELLTPDGTIDQVTIRALLDR